MSYYSCCVSYKVDKYIRGYLVYEEKLSSFSNGNVEAGEAGAGLGQLFAVTKRVFPQ